MDSDKLSDVIPERLRAKISLVLGIPPDKLDTYSVPVLIEELCDTALMCVCESKDDEDGLFTDLVRPVLKRVSAGLGAYRLRRFAGRRPCRIVIGAAAHFPPGWFATEVEFLSVVRREDWERHFETGSIDAILAEHVWEHLTEEQADQAAGVCFEFLRPGGYLRVAVPDGLHPDPEYIEHVRPGGSGAGADDHKTLYTHKSLRLVFERVGFRTRLLEYFDAEGAFQYEDWDPRTGFISRSRRFDERNRDGALNYTSIILDATRPVDDSSP
jgi:predicted SAM-dependent methyltransferase